MFRCALEVAAGINAQPHDRDCVHVDPVPVVGAARTAPVSEGLLQIVRQLLHAFPVLPGAEKQCIAGSCTADRKSTRLNSSHLVISYAVFCLKKKKKNIT